MSTDPHNTLTVVPQKGSYARFVARGKGRVAKQVIRTTGLPLSGLTHERALEICAKLQHELDYQRSCSLPGMRLGFVPWQPAKPMAYLPITASFSRLERGLPD